MKTMAIRALHVGRIVPVYEAAGKVNTRALRALLHRVLKRFRRSKIVCPRPFAPA